MQNRNIKSQIEKGNFKYYCDNCKKSAFPFQNVDNLDCDCFCKYKSSCSLQKFKNIFSLLLSLEYLLVILSTYLDY